MKTCRDLAPIIFFAYNRPEHTLKALNALMYNDLSDQSILYIFCDGPKNDSPADQLTKIAETRKTVKMKQWCKKVIIQESEVNKGLTNSVVTAVTSIINQHNKVIVIEDDMVTAPKFLKYMNDALNYFEKDIGIGSINSYAERFLEKSDFPDYFLLNGSDCWGWATWKDRWDDYTLDAPLLKNRLIESNKVKVFEYGNHMQLLNDQIEGKVNTWDIQWHAVNILHNRKGLFPKKTFIKNIGLDGSGTHCDIVQDFNNGLNLNHYYPSLIDLLAYNKIVFSQNIDNKYRKIYMAKFKTSLIVLLKLFSLRILNKLKRIILTASKLKS